MWTEQPTSDAAIHEWWRIYLKTYRLRHAKTVIEHWINDAPADGRPFLWLTEIDRRTEVENAETWERHYREALLRDPTSIQPGSAWPSAPQGSSQQRGRRGIHEIPGALPRRPDCPGRAGLNAMEMGQRPLMEKFLNRALERADPASRSQGRAQAAMDQGDLPAARRWLDQAVQVDRFDDEAYYLRGRLLKRMGDDAGAAEDIAMFSRLKREQEELLKMHAQLVTHPEDSDTVLTNRRLVVRARARKRRIGLGDGHLGPQSRPAPTCQLLADYYASRPDGAGLANFYRLKATSRAPAPQ